MAKEGCVWPHCRNAADGVYLGKSVCDYHWEKFLASESPRAAEAARKKIGLPAKLEHVSAETPKVFQPAKTSIAPVEPNIEDADDDELLAEEVEDNDETEEVEEAPETNEAASILSRISGGEFDMEI